MKKIILPFLLVSGVFFSFAYVVFSYIFIDPSMLIMIGQSKPEIIRFVTELRGSVSLVLTNQVSLAIVFLLCVIALILIFSKKAIGNRALYLAILIPSVLVFAYPIVSRDIFSYLYYAKMILIHHQNPYQVAPQIYMESDMWLGFLHNVERVYTYGPVALLLNLIPMAVLGAEKLIINVIFYKLTSLVFFLFGAWLLLKITKNRNQTVVLWILNPFIINELLINGHNDLMMIVFFWLAIYLKQKSKTTLSILAYFVSVGTKYLTVILLPILFLPKKLQRLMGLSTIVVIGSYLIYNGNLLWYFSWLYFCLPYLKFNRAQILSILLLQLSLTLTYAGFLESGLWGPSSSIQVIQIIVNMKRLFIPMFVLATVYPFFLEKISSRRPS